MSTPGGPQEQTGPAHWLRGTTVQLMVSTGRVAIATGASSLLLVAVAVVSARVLGPSGRGVLVLVATTATYLMLVSSLGTPISVRVMLGTENRRTVLSDYFGLGLLLTLLQIVVAAVLVAAVLIRSGVPVTLELDLLAAVYAGALVLAYLLVHGLYGIGYNEQAATVQVGGAAVQLVLVILLGVAAVTSPWPYVAAMLAGTLGQIVASMIVLAFGGFLVRPRVSIDAWRKLITQGVPAIGLSLGQAAVLRLDRIIVGFFLAAAAVGVYSVAATATDLVALVPGALSQVLFQKIASRSIETSTANRARLVALLSSVVVAAVLYFLAPIGIEVLVGASFAGAVEPLRILLLAAVVLSSYQIDAYALAARGQIGRAASATVIGLAVIVVADLILIPAKGIVGAAWASVIAYAVMAILVRVIIRRGPDASASRAASI